MPSRACLPTSAPSSLFPIALQVGCIFDGRLGSESVACLHQTIVVRQLGSASSSKTHSGCRMSLWLPLCVCFRCEHLSAVRRTCVLVTNQLQFTKEADLIVYLSDGKVTECGTYAELMVADRGYANLMSQAEVCQPWLCKCHAAACMHERRGGNRVCHGREHQPRGVVCVFSKQLHKECTQPQFV